jgi:hypothetical protein
MRTAILPPTIILIPIAHRTPGFYSQTLLQFALEAVAALVRMIAGAATPFRVGGNFGRLPGVDSSDSSTPGYLLESLQDSFLLCAGLRSGERRLVVKGQIDLR